MFVYSSARAACISIYMMRIRIPLLQPHQPVGAWWAPPCLRSEHRRARLSRFGCQGHGGGVDAYDAFGPWKIFCAGNVEAQF